jgi:hypothetical protein
MHCLVPVECHNFHIAFSQRHYSVLKDQFGEWEKQKDEIKMMASVDLTDFPVTSATCEKADKMFARAYWMNAVAFVKNHGKHMLMPDIRQKIRDVKKILHLPQDEAHSVPDIHGYGKVSRWERGWSSPSTHSQAGQPLTTAEANRIVVALAQMGLEASNVNFQVEVIDPLLTYNLREFRVSALPHSHDEDMYLEQDCLSDSSVHGNQSEDEGC